MTSACEPHGQCGQYNHSCDTAQERYACGLRLWSAGAARPCDFKKDKLMTTCGLTLPKQTPTSVNLTGLGTLDGFTREGVRHRYFRGVPFAQPPVGDLRFRPPQDQKPFPDGRWNATEFGTTCLQEGPAWYSMQNVQTSGEDCLYLNVYAPPPQAGKKYPVMVYMPAGQYQWGSSDDLENLEAPTSGAARDVIYVTVNYRVGVMGFLALDALRGRDVAHGSMGNYGMQDQRAALRFMRKHAAAFGGDVNNIVLWGESAGATSVSTHMAMPASFPYFDKTIMESGAFNMWGYKTAHDAQANGQKAVANIFKYVNDTSVCPGVTEKSDILACLLNSPASVILSSTSPIYGKAGQVPNNYPYGNTMDKCTFAPTVDGVELVASPLVLLNEGKIAQVPVILGTNRDEGSVFVEFQNGHGDGIKTLVPADRRSAWRSAFKNQQNYTQWASNVWDADVAAHLVEWYRPGGGLTPPLDSVEYPWWWAVSRTIGDFVLSCRARIAGGKLQGLGAKPYMYFYTHTPDYSVNWGMKSLADFGAFHGSEVPFAWGDYFELSEGDERTLSDNMVAYWASFAHTGDPNALNPTLPRWPEYTLANDTTIMFGETPEHASFHNISFIHALKKDVCDYFTPYL